MPRKRRLPPKTGKNQGTRLTPSGRSSVGSEASVKSSVAKSSPPEAMKCGKCSIEVPATELRCRNCDSAVSLLVPGETAPRLQARVIELLSNERLGLLWLAEKVVSQQRIFIAEYEPRTGGKPLCETLVS